MTLLWQLFSKDRIGLMQLVNSYTRPYRLATASLAHTTNNILQYLWSLTFDRQADWTSWLGGEYASLWIQTFSGGRGVNFWGELPKYPNTVSFAAEYVIFLTIILETLEAIEKRRQSTIITKKIDFIFKTTFWLISLAIILCFFILRLMLFMFS